MEKYFPFMSVGGDRKYSAEDFAAYFAQFLSNGIFYSSSDKLKVVSSEGMTIKVNHGAAFVEGRCYILDSALLITLDGADGELSRIDRIVVRCDYANRKIEIAVKKGDYATSPVAKQLQRDADVYELALADIFISKGTVEIKQSMITDQRLNTDICGIVTGLVEQADTKDIYNQLADYLFEFKEQTSAEFYEWLEQVKNTLGDDAATSLAAQILELEETDEVLKQDIAKKISNQSGIITMSMLATEVKSAMAGGSVAVVGYESVGPEQLAGDLSEFFCSYDSINYEVVENKIINLTTLGDGPILSLVNTGAWQDRAFYIDVPVVNGKRYRIKNNNNQFVFDNTNVLLVYTDDNYNIIDSLSSTIEDDFAQLNDDTSYVTIPAGSTRMLINYRGETTDVEISQINFNVNINEEHLGDELRDKISVITTDISPNMINPDELLEGYKTINTSGGLSNVSDVIHVITGYMPVVAGITYYVSVDGVAKQAGKIAAYDTDYNFISVVSVKKTITPEVSGYIRVDFYNFDSTDLSADEVISSYQAESDGITPYQPYGNKESYIDYADIKNIPEEVTDDDIVEVVKTNFVDYNDVDDYLIIPKHLYLVKGVPYAILTRNIHRNCYHKVDVIHELALPTQVMRFTDGCDINIPIAFTEPYHTKIGYTANTLVSGALPVLKDLYLHVAEAKIDGGECTIISIGDSICASNLSTHIKWWLSNFGINATMLGTLTNNWSQFSDYKYGIYEHLEAEQGEGRGSWRLLDYAEMSVTKDSGEVYHSHANPFRNPETNEFDFDYYMSNNGFTSCDYLILTLGTNDIGGTCAFTDTDGEGLLYTPTMDELMDNNSAYSIIAAYNKIIESAKSYNPDIKIAIIPPQTISWDSRDTSFNYSALTWASKVIDELEDPDNGVYVLMPTISQGKFSVQNISGGTDIGHGNYTNTAYNVHLNGMGQLVHALYPASWIVNMI